MTQGLKGLFASTKGTNVALVFVVLAFMVYQGRLEQDFLKQFIEIVMPTWLLAHAGEKGAKAFAARPQAIGETPPLASAAKHE